MDPIQLTGLASGLDWRSLIDQLTQLDRVPQNQLRTEQSKLDKESSALDKVTDLLATLQSSAQALAKSDAFLSRQTTLGTENSLVLSASAGVGAAAATYTVEVQQVATASRLSGTSNAASPLAATSDVSGLTLADMRTATAISAGTFAVNGKTVTVDPADSLQEVFDAISTATSGAVTAAYNPATDTIDLTGSGPIVLGSGADTSNFLSAVRLYSNGTAAVSSSAALGLTDLDASIADSGLAAAITAVDGSGNGSFTLNGISIAFNVNDDSLNDLMERIEQSEAGVRLEYDVSNDRFSFVNQDTGSLGIGAEETAGGILDALGLNSGSGTFSLGANARFSVNGGGTLVSAGNVAGEAVHGLAGVSLTLKTLGTETVEVAPRLDESRGRIDSFIEAYNELQEYLDTNTAITQKDGEVTTSVLTGNREVANLSRTLRQTLFSPISGLSATLKRLQDVGIDFAGSSDQLEIADSDLLTEALENNAENLSRLFADTTDGLSARLNTLHENYTGTDGIFSRQKENLETRNTRLDEEIANIERQLEQRRDQLTQAFLKMEEAQSFIQNQLSQLNRTFAPAK